MDSGPLAVVVFGFSHLLQPELTDEYPLEDDIHHGLQTPLVTSVADGTVYAEAGDCSLFSNLSTLEFKLSKWSLIVYIVVFFSIFFIILDICDFIPLESSEICLLR